MSYVEGSLDQFTKVSIGEARVDSKLPDGITLRFCLSPTPVSIRWKSVFTNLDNDKRASVISTTNPHIDQDDVVWKVVEGDIPNAKRYVARRVEQANVLLERVPSDAEPQHAQAADTSEAELDRLQAILDAPNPRRIHGGEFTDSGASPQLTLYGVLGVDRDMTQGDIKGAYRRLLLKVHPDHGGDEALFRTVQAAFECLSDPERRAHYDRSQ